MLAACLPFGPVVTSNETFCPSLSDLKPCMLIAEKCANRSSPPPSGVIKPKPFASLNHFTVPVAIRNSLSTRIKRDVARTMFRSQGKYGGGTTVGGRAERALRLGTKHADHYTPLWEDTSEGTALTRWRSSR